MRFPAKIHVQRQFQKALLDINILFSKKQTVGEWRDFKPKTGMNFRGKALQAGLYSEKEEIIHPSQ